MNSVVAPIGVYIGGGATVSITRIPWQSWLVASVSLLSKPSTEI